MKRALSLVAWGYFIVVFLLLILFFGTGDRWWIGTILLFSPRWVVALPLLFLCPLAICFNRRSLIILCASIMMMFSFLGLQINSGKKAVDNNGMIRILSCNVHSGDFDFKKLLRVIQDENIDIVALQEFPVEVKKQMDAISEWNCYEQGPLAIFSRFPLKNGAFFEGMHPPLDWHPISMIRCMISSPFGEIAFHTLILPTPREGIEEMLDRRIVLNISKKQMLVKGIENRLKTSSDMESVASKQSLPTIVAGDFNMPVESRIYREVWGEYKNAFSDVGSGFGFTKYQSLKGITYGVRIDHLLTKNGIIPVSCKVGPDVGSDHRPLIVEVAFQK